MKIPFFEAKMTGANIKDTGCLLYAMEDGTVGRGEKTGHKVFVGFHCGIAPSGNVIVKKNIWYKEQTLDNDEPIIVYGGGI